MLPKNLAFVDVETTGGSATADRIIEIGILRVEDGQLVETFQSLVNPEATIPSFIESMTHISNSDVERAPTFSSIAKDVAATIADCVFVAHNVRFDYAFVKNELKREGISFCPKQLCTVKLSRHLFPAMTHHNLDALIEAFQLSCGSRHRAFDDAKVLWDFYQLVSQKYQTDQLAQAIAVVTKRPSLPVHLSESTLDELPECAGVYIFYGDEDIPLYVGKSINIKDRVYSHFASDHSHSKEMLLSQQVKRIDTIKTAGELGALLTEAHLVKELKPIYNYKLRHARKLVCLTKQTDENGYDRVKISEASEDAIPALDSVIGFFKSLKQVKGFLDRCAEESGLCKKLLGLEHTSGGCFGYRLGKCAGACVGKEIPIKYNLRFLEAFMKTKMKRWPFDGPIVIVEKDAVEELCDAVVIDQWQCIKKVTLPDTAMTSIPEQDILKLESELADQYRIFDLDAYKILLSYLSQKKYLDNIYQVSQQLLRPLSHDASALGWI